MSHEKNQLIQQTAKSLQFSEHTKLILEWNWKKNKQSKKPCNVYGHMMYV